MLNDKYQINPQLQISNGTKRKFDIYNRVFRFTEQTAQVLNALPKNIFINEYIKQIIRSSGSVGANLTEADGAITKKDFINKLAIARKEAKESLHWLNLIRATSPNIPPSLDNLIQENTEIVLILSKIIINTQKNANSKT